jgi:hypothetical protein
MLEVRKLTKEKFTPPTIEFDHDGMVLPNFAWGVAHPDVNRIAISPALEHDAGNLIMTVFHEIGHIIMIGSFFMQAEEGNDLADEAIADRCSIELLRNTIDFDDPDDVELFDDMVDHIREKYKTKMSSENYGYCGKGITKEELDKIFCPELLDFLRSDEMRKYSMETYLKYLNIALANK